MYKIQWVIVFTEEFKRKLKIKRYQKFIRDYASYPRGGYKGLMNFITAINSGYFTSEIKKARNENATGL